MRSLLPLAALAALFVALLTAPASAQDVIEDTTSAWRYAPLHVGDAWEYEVEVDQNVGFTHVYALTRLVRKDTLIEGLRYAVVEERTYGGEHIPSPPAPLTRYLARFDSASATLFMRTLATSDERPALCPLDLPFGAEEAPCGSEVTAQVDGGYDVPVQVGEETVIRTKKGLGYALVVSFGEVFAADIGLVSSFFQEAGSEEWTLLTARIEGEVVGDAPSERFPGTPDPVEPSRYFPMGIGDEWHFQTCDPAGCERGVRTWRVTGEESVSDTLYRVVAQSVYERRDQTAPFELVERRDRRFRYDAVTTSVLERGESGEVVFACNLGADLGQEQAESPCGFRDVGVRTDPVFGRTKFFSTLPREDEFSADVGLRRSVQHITNEETRLFYSNVGGVMTGTPFEVSEEPRARPRALSLSAFPNPASGRLVVTLGGDGRPSGARLEGYDALGRRVFAREVTGESLTLDVSGWAPGVYTFRLAGGEEAVVRRVLVH